MWDTKGFIFSNFDSPAKGIFKDVLEVTSTRMGEIITK